ncbi:hypothetical protein L873DRAFT_1795010 [Choiromyces venosus 120613-1]|uniref:Uncharacterized protein n=1 Tax=Choiromyces venosus 120613-1 TaxID=1336337 RepID=A0A3N4J2B0_9PEZI|nr:hypothetical protein L873DRAFT_1795010 [Choiromyces venosus 120613-1]
MPKYSLAPIRHVSESPRCQPSNGASLNLLVPVPTELQAAMQIVFTSEFLQALKTDILMPSHLLTLIGHVPESPQCQLSNGTSHVLLTSVPTGPQAAMKRFLLVNLC